MQFTTALLAGLGLAGSVLAQTSRDPGFSLKLISDNANYNGSFLSACHEGAGIESLCLLGGSSGSSSTLFYQNTTEGAQSGVAGDSAPQPLQYYLNASTTGEYEEMGFFSDPSTNVAHPLFGTGEVQPVAFDSYGHMNVQTNLDDSVTPPNGNTSRAYYNWYVCETYFVGYQYTTLNWVYASTPHNPSCERVTVEKVAVPAP